jgi:hypothetical protein
LDNLQHWQTLFPFQDLRCLCLATTLGSENASSIREGKWWCMSQITLKPDFYVRSYTYHISFETRNCLDEVPSPFSICFLRWRLWVGNNRAHRLFISIYFER